MAYRVALAQRDWKTCSVCKGTRQVFMEGDLHKSAGTIPCPSFLCEGGLTKYKIVETKAEIAAREKRQDDLTLFSLYLKD